MINYFRKMFNLDKVAELESGVDALLENNKQLEAEVREYKGYKLKYQVAMLQNNEAEYLELLEMAEKVEKWESSKQVEPFDPRYSAFSGRQNIAAQQLAIGQAQQSSNLMGLLGSQGASLANSLAANRAGRWL